MTGYIYQLFDLLPKANDHDTAKGWLFDYGFLQDVVKMAEKYGDPVSPAQAECVLFAGASILQQQIEGTPATPEPVEGDAPASTSDGSAGDADEQPAAVCLLPLRPPTVGDYEVIREALKVCQWSRRRACVVVYGRRDGLSYPWLRKVADYWEIAEADRPSILAWELIGTDEIPGNLAIRLGLDLTPDQLEAAIDAANLTRCPECDRWATLDELDETDACTRCTA